ncbi:MAG: hypothetical protein Q8O75_00415 [bacterium]|nr:hypothetical protein [bacterium]
MVKKAAVLPIIIFGWVVITLIFIFGSINIFQKVSSPLKVSFFLANSSKNTFDLPQNIKNESNQFSSVLAAVKGGDVRPVLVDKFLAKHASPMTGLGKEFVAAADQYGLDWRLLPAIAFQESNLGKKIPRDSYNPFGWAIYKGATAGVYFDNWSKGINTVAAKIKENYVNNGLSTPETIATKYTSSSSPTWVYAVNTAMEEISNSTY